MLFLFFAAPAVRFSDACNAIRSPPPLLGEHTCQILSKHLNMPLARLQELRSLKAIDYPDDMAAFIEHLQKNKSEAAN